MWLASALARSIGWMLAAWTSLEMLHGRGTSWSTTATAALAYLLVTYGRSLRHDHLARQMARWEAIGEDVARRRQQLR